MKDFSPDSPNIISEIHGGGPLLLCFAGMASQIHEMIVDYEWRGSTRDMPCSKVYVRDPEQLWYFSWLDELEEKLRALIEQANPSEIRSMGASAGGYGAVYYGYKLKADKVHAFGAQTFTELGLTHYESKTEIIHERPRFT